MIRGGRKKFINDKCLKKYINNLKFKKKYFKLVFFFFSIYFNFKPQQNLDNLKVLEIFIEIKDFKVIDRYLSLIKMYKILYFLLLLKDNKLETDKILLITI